MAIQQTNGTGFVERSGYGQFPLNSGDWTIFCQFRYTALPVGFAQILDLFTSLGPPDNLYLGSDNNTSDLILEVTSHTGVDHTTTPAAITVNNYNWVGITYVASTHVWTLYLNNAVAGSITVDVSATVWDTIQLLSSGSTSPNVSIAYLRAWSSALTIGQLLTESTSIVAVVTSGLIFDCPLQTSIDLTAHNNTLNQFAATGTIITDTTDPLLSIVAGPPTNIDPNTATLIDYNSAVFQNTLTAGAATDVWHKAIAIAGDKVWGAQSFGDLVTYKPRVIVYDGLADALANSPLVTGNQNQPIQFQVTVGNTYYFKSLKNGAVTPAVLQLSVLRGLTLTIPGGSLAIRDVTQGFPLAFLDSTIGYPINWVNDFPVGEEVGILPSGNVLVSDDTTNFVHLYNNLGSTLIVDPPVASRFTTLGSNQLSYVAAKGFAGADQFVLIDPTGVVSTTTYSIGAGGLQSISLNPDSTIAYIEQNTSSTTQPVKKFVLATSTLSTFVAGISGFFFSPNLLGLQDGTVLVGYRTSPVTASKVLKYNADGTTGFTFNLNADDQIERLAIDINAPLVDFWVWSQPTNQFSRFFKIKLSDGTFLTTINNVQKYTDGIYQGGVSVINTPVRFGHSFSCPLWITLAGTSVNEGAGIYFLTGTSVDNPRENHDTIWTDASLGTTHEVAIPDPFAETYLAGDE